MYETLADSFGILKDKADISVLLRTLELDIIEGTGLSQPYMEELFNSLRREANRNGETEIQYGQRLLKLWNSYQTTGQI